MNLAINSVSLFAICCLVGFSLSCLVLYAPAMQARKIQNKPRSKTVLKEHLPVIAVNIAMIMCSTAIGCYLLDGVLLVQNHPTFFYVIGELLAFYLLDDLYQYWLHRAMHQNKAFFHRVHRLHHNARQPMPLDYLYVHPLEAVLGAMGIAFALLFLGSIEIYTFYAYIIVKNLHQFALHSGVRSLGITIIPFLSNNEHHERHHSGPGFSLNYAQNFTYLDKIFGTEEKNYRSQNQQAYL